MVGNSLKSDIIPVLNIGGWGIHVPYHTNWEYEKVDTKVESDRFIDVIEIKEIMKFL